jgi:hypothetical protein
MVLPFCILQLRFGRSPPSYHQLTVSVRHPTFSSALGSFHRASHHTIAAMTATPAAAATHHHHAAATFGGFGGGAPVSNTRFGGVGSIGREGGADGEAPYQLT